MKQTVTLHDFRDAFRAMGRADQFTYDGLEILFDYLEEIERDTGEEMEMDVIAFCCDFYESSPKEIAESYGLDLSDCGEHVPEMLNRCEEYLAGETVVCGRTNGSIVYKAF